MNLSGPQRKFVEGIVSGKERAKAYMEAYPNCSEASARSKASRLVTNGNIEAEIARLRGKAENRAGSAVLTLAVKRKFLHGVVVENEDERTCDRLKALELDAKLAGEFTPDKLEVDVKFTVTIGQ